MKQKIMSITLLLFSSLLGHAHGEDRQGPNGGYVRMPGAFHTELVSQDKKQIRVYLLDMDWKNPSVYSSSVNAKYVDKKETQSKCSAENNFFLCIFEKELDLNRGKIIIDAKRENQVGNAVSYELPLRLTKSHGGHH